MSRNAVPYTAIVPNRHASIGAGDVDLPDKTVQIHIGGAGDLVLEDEVGTQVTYTVVAGSVVDGHFTRKIGSGTTATSLVAKYVVPR